MPSTLDIALSRLRNTIEPCSSLTVGAVRCDLFGGRAQAGARVLWDLTSSWGLYLAVRYFSQGELPVSSKGPWVWLRGRMLCRASILVTAEIAPPCTCQQRRCSTNWCEFFCSEFCGANKLYKGLVQCICKSGCCTGRCMQTPLMVVV